MDPILEAKGVTIKALPVFIKKEYGPDGFTKWLAELPPKAKEIFSVDIMPMLWYPMVHTIAEPHTVMTRLFFNGDKERTREVGNFSAAGSLRGVYKVFLKIGSPEWMIGKVSTILSTFYRPVTSKVETPKPKHGTIFVYGLNEPTGYAELRMAGWCEKALEISSGHKGKVDISKSIARGDPHSQFDFSW